MKETFSMFIAVMSAAVCLAADEMNADAIINGVHGYMPDNYVVPKEPEVRERLEWFKDQKIALMMHFGMYTQMGIIESWPLCDKEEAWSRVQIDWTDDAETFKRQYWNLWKSFNPVRFQPKKWAHLAKDNGFRYLIFTTKHHDGFCLFDTKYTDFKVTNPECPFSKDPRADIVRNVFDAFRAEGLGIAAYFSKPDWHNEDYWENHGIGRRVTRMPTYDVRTNPEKWAKFREFTKNQIVELVRDYGPVDAIWLDGGQVQRKCGLDINIEDIIAEARTYKPDLISVDRTAGGSCENVITPEQQVPPEPLAVPWESCITMGTGFSYRYDDEYKSPRELVHLLLDVIAKGGNLALNVAPGPDGRLPQPAIARMEELGAWLKTNGAGVYATRPAAPFAKDDWRFTGSKDGKAVYAFRLWKEGECDFLSQVIPCREPEKVVGVKHLGTGIAVPFKVTEDGLAIRLPETFRTDPYADGFVLEKAVAVLPVRAAGAGAQSCLLSDAEAERIAQEKLARMTLEEKTSLCGLCATMYLNAIPRVGIDREWSFNDCGHCMKPEHNRDRWGYVGGVDDRSTSLPCPSALAMTWNPSLAAKHGDVMGSQMRSRDKSQMLGPGINIMRNPLCGRNWEYMSEDPLVTARMVVPLVKAVQEHGLACTPKHFCLNSQELNRFDAGSTVDDRALHEIYLPAFEAVVKDAGVLSIMTAYNRYNGTFCSENSYLQKAMLREQWGFKGTIVTDWGGQHSCDNAVMNGGGIEANCGKDVYWLTDFYGHSGKDKFPLATAVKEGRVPEAAVDAAAMRVLYVMAKTGFLTGTQDKGERLTAAHQQVAREIGEEAIVLAKNSRGVLPLDKAKTKKLVVFGNIADLEQAQLGSSCECHVLHEITFLKGLRECLGDGCEITCYPLGDEASDGRPKGIDHLILETFDPTSPDAFAARAWVKKVGKAKGEGQGQDEVVSYDPATVLKAGEATAGDVIEWSSSLVAPETGQYVFAAEATDCANTEIIVGGKADATPTLERGKSYTVTFRVTAASAASACSFGWIVPSAQRPAWDEVKKTCAEADAVLVFTGTTMGFGQAHETEGADRPNMLSAPGHDREIAEILSWKLPRTVVVCRTGSAIELPWIGACDTMLITSYLGQEAGRPMARTLFGEVNPSGKMTYSWPKRYADTPTGHFGERAYNVTNSVYLEGVYVGYRWYEKRGIAVDFPFGHGLSYTRFEYGEVKVEEIKVEGQGQQWKVSVPVKNVGGRDGAEVVQLYVSAKKPKVDRPVKELKGFSKVFVKKGETATAEFILTSRDLAYWDTLESGFRADKGEYELLIGSSSADIRRTVGVIH